MRVVQAACRSAVKGISFRSLTNLATTRMVVVPMTRTSAISQVRWMGAAPVPTTKQAEEKMLTILRLFDDIDPSKLTMDSHFINDLGLESLDVVECVMHVEDEFSIQLSDAQAETITSPRDILQYINTSDH